MSTRFSTVINMVKLVLEATPLNLREIEPGELSGEDIETTATRGRAYQLDLSGEGAEDAESQGMVDVERPFNVLVYEFIEREEAQSEQELDLHDFCEDVIRKLWNADGIDVMAGSHAQIAPMEAGDVIAAQIPLAIRYEFDRTVT